MEKILAWAKLIRLPNTATVIADVLAGFVLAVGDWSPSLHLVLATVAVVLLYWAGMVWNDVADIEQDRIERPNRPLPSGAIGMREAFNLGLFLLALGIFLAFCVDWMQLRFLAIAAMHSGAGLTAIVLVACILLYDLVAKKTHAAPWLMGSCRGCSLLLGCMAGGMAIDSVEMHVPRLGIIAACIGHGVYVAGFTLAGRKEAAENSKNDLWVGWIIALIGIAILGSVDFIAVESGIDPNHRRVNPTWIYPALMFALALPLFRRALKSIDTTAGRDVQAAIKQAIITIIFFDAVIALQFGSTVQAIVVCSLVFPLLVLGKWLYST